MGRTLLWPNFKHYVIKRINIHVSSRMKHPFEVGNRLPWMISLRHFQRNFGSWQKVHIDFILESQTNKRLVSSHWQQTFLSWCQCWLDATLLWCRLAIQCKCNFSFNMKCRKNCSLIESHVGAGCPYYVPNPPTTAASHVSNCIMGNFTFFLFLGLAEDPFLTCIRWTLPRREAAEATTVKMQFLIILPAVFGKFMVAGSTL